MKKILLLLVLGFLLQYSTVSALSQNNRFQSAFTENKGQVTDQFGNARDDVKYIFQSQGFKIILKEKSWSYEFSKINHRLHPSAKNISADPEFDPDDDLQFQTNRTDVRLLNANLHPAIIAEEEAPGVMNFYNSKNLPQGFTGIHHYKKITYRDIYPNIDMVWELHEPRRSGSIMQPEYSFIIHPGGDPDLIRMEYNGNASLDLRENSLHLASLLGTMDESSPQSYELGKNQKNETTIFKNGNVISFSVQNEYTGNKKYDSQQTLVIDPTITYSTYFGGDSTDYAEGMEFDAEENIIITGRTASNAAIATIGSYDNSYNGGSYDMFLLKFNAAFQLQWSTYFGGSHVDYGWGLAIDDQDNIYLGGEAYSDSLATPGAEQKTIEGGESDGLVAKFNPGGTLEWSRYFGGAAKDQVLGLAIDHLGRLIITGYTLSTDSIATVGAFKTSYGGNGDIFLAALDTMNGNAIWSTYYGANKDDRGHHVAIDAFNHIYLSGTALSTTGIATPGTFHSSLGGIFDGYLAKFSQDGFPIWGTYVGGQYEDRGRDCVIDHAGNIYMTGFTQSDTGIATPGTWKTIHSPGIDSTGYNTLDAYLVKFDTSGHRLWGTYFGDTLSETSRGIAVNQKDEIFITGATYSAEGIAYGNVFQTTLGGISDAYFAKFDSTGALVFSSYFGGSDEEQVGGYGLIIRVDHENNFYLCSATRSPDSISTSNAYQTTLAGDYDLFIAKFADTLIADGNTNPRSPCFNGQIIICPNPVHDLFFAKVTSPEPASAIAEIYSIEGKLIVRKNLELHEGENTFQFDLNEVSRGIYFITIRDAKFVWMKKLVVE